MNMNLDFNDAPEQSERGAIPEDSVVKVRLTIRRPKQEYASPDNPDLFQARSGLVGLDCEFEVIGGSFNGRPMWDNLWLPPHMQNIPLEKKQKGACEGCAAKMRAILEAARGINPKDQSDPARNARRIGSWEDLSGLEFWAKVGIEPPKAGARYVNNNIKKIITMDMPEYRQVMTNGEIITDKPVPAIPMAEGLGAAPQPEWGTQTRTTTRPRTDDSDGWGVKPQAAQTPTQPQAQPQSQGQPMQSQGGQAQPNNGRAAMPNWGAPPAGRQNDTGPAFPSEANGMDNVPY